MNKQKTLWEKLAKENSKYYIFTDKGRKITEKEFRDSGQTAYQRLIANDNLLKNKNSLLDFGCGTGRLTEFMAKDFKMVIGIDISGEMIAQAKDRLKNLKNVQFIETDGVTIPLPSAFVEAVFAYLVFQHLKTREMVESTFAEIYRVLTPDGIFKALLRSDKQKDMNRWWSGVEYSPEAIKEVYLKSGFKLLKTEPQDKYAYWLWLQK